MKSRAAMIYAIGDDCHVLVIKRYELDDINDGYHALRDGENLRGVIAHG
jgi:Zn-dependent alcohol dehydrogenase